MSAEFLLAMGLGLQATSTIQQGRTAEAQGKFQAEVAARNQAALNRQAEAEREAARVDAAAMARKEKIVAATQRAVSGKSGGGLVGSSLAGLTNTAYQFAMDRNFILRHGFTRSQELKERGALEMAKGRWAEAYGTATKRASILSTAGSVGLGVGKYKYGLGSTYS